VISGYVIGQVITSALFGLFVYVTLWLVGVPDLMLLAVLAALLDAIPIVGVPLATIPAVLLAATVSWQAAIVVVVAYTLYQQFENYVLVPRIYGNTLQVTSLSILVGVLVGAQLLGVLGVVLALPITAAIPVLERVWREEIPDPLTTDMI
jgi:predicted PurR-regulated permease PerM